MSVADDRSPRTLDAVIVGAGFAGLYMLLRLRRLGLDAHVLEAGDGVGGTWYWNRYPGARCDVESVEYSYQFDKKLEQEWDWSERYATQPEILAYANHVADRFELRRDISFNARVRSARFDEAANRWLVETEDGRRLEARWCIMATGCLSSTNTPRFEGLGSFRGPTYHTGNWPHQGVNFSGQRVGIIGTGSSAIQSIPIIARQADHLTVFQRTPTYAVPAHNARLDDAERRALKAQYAAIRQQAWQNRNGIRFTTNPVSALAVDEAERRREYERRWAQGGLAFSGAFNDLLIDKAANDTASEFVRGKIRELVADRETAERLSPTNVLACKRLCIDSGYYETYNRPNVSLVDVGSTPIEAITPGGLRIAGREYELDAIVFATGFDAMTGALARIDIRGRQGLRLSEKWAAGPRTYLGLATAGFPNLFTITGPGSPSVLSNMLPSIEQHVDWIAGCIAHLRDAGFNCIEAERDAEDSWVEHVNQVAGFTLFPTCNSWYLGANVPGKPRVFMPYIGVPPYVEKCNDVAAKGYEGFALARR